MVSSVKTHRNVSDKVQKKELKKCKPILRSKPPLSWLSFWQNLPDLIFSDIMLMMGLSVQSPSMIGDGCIEDLHKCRQVSQSWNVMITHMTKYKKDKIRREAE